MLKPALLAASLPATWLPATWLLAIWLLLPIAPPACAQNPTGAGQGGPAGAAGGVNARNRYCFNEKEAEAEAEVRAGILLREILRRCARFDGESGQTYLDDWYKFDREHGEQLRAAVAMRSNVLKRIYPDRTVQEQWENDATIATRAAPQVDAGVCKAAYDVVDKIKAEAWQGFKYYANLQQKLLSTEIPLCRK